MLTVALPKGRIAKETLEIFETIFGDSFKFDDRKLILETPNFVFYLYEIKMLQLMYIIKQQISV